MKKKIIILGSTGSIGLSTLNIVDKKKNYFDVFLLSSNKNFKLICKQIYKYKPKFFIINNYAIYKKIKKKFKKKNIKILNNFDTINLQKKIDIAVSAIPGIAGLLPTITIIKSSRKILLANKESIICGWELIRSVAKKNRTKIIPLDSEHYSIYKLLENHKLEDVKKIYITASGGPFLNFKPNQFKNIQPSDALKHPKWKMGKKITIDSATLMNKILELIEAQKLFSVPNNKLEILIHPNSLVHAIVMFKNGLTKFIYHETSMIIPIANAIFENKLDIENFYFSKKKNIIENLIFKHVDKKVFPVIKLKNKVNEYPSTSIIINSSNEILVDHFLRKKIAFLSIFKIIMSILKDRNYRKYAIKKPKSINQINEINLWAKNTTIKKITKYNV
jgi:1-deoxy-D-xylulose-5-phosphate reductoisomerase